MAATCSVFLNVRDIEKSLAFYKALGFKTDNLYRRDGEGAVRYADLSYQGAELGLGHIAINDDPEYRAWVGTPLGAGVLIYFAVPNVDAVFAKAKAAGAVIEHEPEDRSYGRVLTLNDPDGYVLVFIKEPRKAPVRKAAAKAKKAVKKAVGRTPAAKSLAAARKQAVRKGATGKSVAQMRKTDRKTARGPARARRG